MKEFHSQISSKKSCSMLLLVITNLTNLPGLCLKILPKKKKKILPNSNTKNTDGDEKRIPNSLSSVHYSIFTVSIISSSYFGQFYNWLHVKRIIILSFSTHHHHRFHSMNVFLKVFFRILSFHKILKWIASRKNIYIFCFSLNINPVYSYDMDVAATFSIIIIIINYEYGAIWNRKNTKRKKDEFAKKFFLFRKKKIGIFILVCLQNHSSHSFVWCLSVDLHQII